MDWWTDFWTWVNSNQLAATIIGGLILAALLWGFARLPKIGPHVRVGLKWLWSWRPISVRRHRRDIANLYEVVSADVEGAAKAAASKAIADSAELEKLKKKLVDVMVENRIASEGEGQQAGSLISVASTKLPGPEPRWKLVTLKSDAPNAQRYAILNLVPGSVAMNVRMDNSDSGWFSFDDAAFWPDLSGESRGEFGGVVTSTDERNKAQLVLTWFDENREKKSMYFAVRAAPKPDPWAKVPF
ncbi:hypothetical protein AB0N61_00315 [Microbacterium sp. NPDC089320]|uniref:hypothetical protein n=1 Tax=Microbacterium sp. NPDC089320 TaxID=3155182 RepID=UPI0034327384